MIRRSAVVFAISLMSLLATVVPVAAGDDVPVTVEIVVRSDGSLAELEALAAEEGGVVVGPVIESRGVYTLAKTVEVDPDKIEEESDKEAEDFAKDIENGDDVVWVEPVWIENAEDTRFHAWPYGLKKAKDRLDNSEVFAGLSLEEAHLSATGLGAIVAVIDTGVDMDHPYLAGRLLPGYDMLDDDADPSDQRDRIDDDGDGEIDEAYGHGTFVAGVVLQIAPGASILPIRALDADGGGEIPAVVEAVYFAIEQGADVINLSFSLASDEKPDSLKDALKEAKDADIVVVGASGNHGEDEKVYPASESSVVSVASVDALAEEDVSGFSSYGGWVTVAAPGVGIVSSVPGGFASWAGTSMASPVVAGQVALLVEFAPNADRTDLEKAIKDSARKMNGQNKPEKGVIDVLESLIEIG